MFIRKRYRVGAAAIAAGLLLTSVATGQASATTSAHTPSSVTPAAGTSAHGSSAHGSRAKSKHVLLLSVDGLHQSDLAWYIRKYPHSALASLVSQGTEYTHAQTTFPSDSFPGMVAQLTGGDPGTSGVFYDDTYNRALLEPGTIDCSTAHPGTEVSWTEAADRSQNPITLDAGQGLAAPP